MNNTLKEPAFQVTELNANGTPYHMERGFTKHEYAALMIAQGLVAKYNLKEPEDQEIIAKMSYQLSAEILNQFS